MEGRSTEAANDGGESAGSDDQGRVGRGNIPDGERRKLVSVTARGRDRLNQNR